MPRPKTNEEILVQQTRELDRAQKQKRRYDRQKERNRDKKQKYDSGSGHGVAVLFDEKPAESNSEYNRALENERRKRAQQIDEAEASRDKAKQEAKDAKEAMKESKRKLVGDKIKEGKGIGIVLYNAKGQESDINGKPVKCGSSKPASCSPKNQKGKGKKDCDTKCNHNKTTSWGHQIRQLYRDRDGTIYAVAQSEGNGLMWGIGYNPSSGVWQTSDKNLTEAQIKSRTKGKTLILDNTGGC